MNFSDMKAKDHIRHMDVVEAVMAFRVLEGELVEYQTFDDGRKKVSRFAMARAVGLEPKDLLAFKTRSRVIEYFRRYREMLRRRIHTLIN